MKLFCILLFVFSLGFSNANASKIDEAHNAFGSGDYDKSFRIFSELSNQGDAESSYMLGTMYLMVTLPEEILRDLMLKDKRPQDVGVRLIEKSAKMGFAGGLEMIASFHERGFAGYRKDKAIAIEFREKAAATGDAVAEYNLAVALQEDGDFKDNARAYELYLSSAKKNNPLSFFNLGVTHFKRETIDDKIISYAWFFNFLNWRADDSISGLAGQMSQDALIIATQAIKEISKAIGPDNVQKAEKLSTSLLE